MQQKLPIALAAALVGAAFLAHWIYAAAYKQIAIRSDKLTQEDFKRLAKSIAVRQRLAALFAFVCLMPLLRLETIWNLAMQPLNLFGMAAIAGVLVVVGKLVLKVEWTKLIFKDFLSGWKCFALAIAGFMIACIVGPLVTDPLELIRALKESLSKA